MNLSLKRPLLPLLSNAITHHEPRHIAVCALMQLVNPRVEHGHADNLHLEDLHPLIEPRHFSDEVRASAPCALGVFGEHVPHFVEATFCV